MLSDHQSLIFNVFDKLRIQQSRTIHKHPDFTYTSKTKFVVRPGLHQQRIERLNQPSKKKCEILAAVRRILGATKNKGGRGALTPRPPLFFERPKIVQTGA